MAQDTVAQLDHILNAKSVSLVGASNKEGSFGRLFIEGLIKMGCKNIYPVNPRSPEIMGLKAYPTITDVPHEIDLAVLLTPPEPVLDLVKECVKKKVKGVVVFAAGFAELGEEGQKAQQEIARVAVEGGTRVIGPNCLGIYTPSAGICTFPQALMKGMPTESGSIGGFAQSGSFVDHLTWYLSRKGLRFSSIISSGNECDLNAADFLEYFGADKNTTTIVSYLEGVKDGRRFFEIARDVAPKKPVIVWKGGATDFGARAAASHTGSLAGSQHVWEAMFRQTGIISVTSFEEVIDCAQAFYHLPLPKGRRVAVISGQGGTGVGTADNCIRMGLELARLSDSTINKMKELIVGVGVSVGNPADIGVVSLMKPHLYGETIKILAADENVDMILAITSPNRPCIEGIVKAAKELDKPIVTSVFSLPELAPEEYAFLAENGVPAYSDPKKGAFVLTRMAEYSQFRADI